MVTQWRHWPTTNHIPCGAMGLCAYLVRLSGCPAPCRWHRVFPTDIYLTNPAKLIYGIYANDLHVCLWLHVKVIRVNAGLVKRIWIGYQPKTKTCLRRWLARLLSEAGWHLLLKYPKSLKTMVTQWRHGSTTNHIPCGAVGLCAYLGRLAGCPAPCRWHRAFQADSIVNIKGHTNSGINENDFEVTLRIHVKVIHVHTSLWRQICIGLQPITKTCLKRWLACNQKPVDQNLIQFPCDDWASAAWRFSVQSYCVREERQVTLRLRSECLPGSLPQFLS